MDPATLIAFSKTVLSFVSNIKAIRKLKKDKEQLLAQIRKARGEFQAARSASHEIADELQQYTEAARASDEISRTMTELGTMLSVSPDRVDWTLLQFEVDRLRHHGPLSNLARFKNSSAIEPTPFKNDLSAAIQQIDAELSAFTIDKNAIESLRSRTSAIVQACDMLYRVRNRVVNDFASRLGVGLAG
jgi:prefoldin subunit 5